MFENSGYRFSINNLSVSRRQSISITLFMCPSNTNWELLSIDSDKECVEKIASYCTSGAGLDDAACQNYWDLFIECGTYTLSTETTLELQKGITCGRGGRSVIYTFAAGNEGLYGENVNFEGFLMSIYTISVASTGPTDEDLTTLQLVLLCLCLHQEVIRVSGHHIWHGVPGNECDNAGQGTCVIFNKCIRKNVSHKIRLNTGTSYACPIVSGVVALMLEANPNLTWRDVQKFLLPRLHKLMRTIPTGSRMLRDTITRSNMVLVL